MADGKPDLYTSIGDGAKSKPGVAFASDTHHNTHTIIMSILSIHEPIIPVAPIMWDIIPSPHYSIPQAIYWTHQEDIMAELGSLGHCIWQGNRWSQLEMLQ